MDLKSESHPSAISSISEHATHPIRIHRVQSSHVQYELDYCTHLSKHSGSHHQLRCFPVPLHREENKKLLGESNAKTHGMIKW